MHYFCLDMGGTGTRGAVFAADGTEIGRATSSAGALSLGADVSAIAVRDVWTKISNAVKGEMPNPAQVKTCVGVAGIGLPGRKTELKSMLTEFGEFEAVSDGYGNLLAATNGEPGALIAVGTGVAATRLDAQFRLQSLSGWGFPAGDLGSGAWIGLHALSAVLKWIDGSPVRPALGPVFAKNVMQVCGSSAADLMLWHTSARAKDFAQLAPIVLEAAKHEDEFCINLLAMAAQEIADVAVALRVPDRPIHIGGGLGEVMLPAIKMALPDVEFLMNRGDPLVALFRLATGARAPELLTQRPGIKAFEMAS